MDLEDYTGQGRLEFQEREQIGRRGELPSG
jgi:hypothetical protein